MYLPYIDVKGLIKNVYRTEINMIIIAACIPVLSSLAVATFHRAKGSLYPTQKPDYAHHRSIQLPVVGGKRSITALTLERASGGQADEDWIDDGSCPNLIAPNRIKRVDEINVSYQDL